MLFDISLSNIPTDVSHMWSEVAAPVINQAL
jgi:hypothetical protein